MPAFDQRRSTEPRWEEASAAAAAMEAGSPTSRRRMRISPRPPAARASRSRAAAGERQVASTSSPRPACWRTSSRPIPREAPVTTTRKSALVPRVLDLADVLLGERDGGATPVLLEDLEELVLVRPDLSDGAALPLVERLVAVAHPPVAALGLELDAQLGNRLHHLAPHERHHVADLPLGTPAEAQVGDVQELGEVHHHLEVGGRGVGEDEAGVLGRDPLLQGPEVDPRDLGHETVVLVAETGPVPRLGPHVLEPFLLELHVALRLLLEADADAVAHELVGERAGHAADAEPEDHLLEGGGVACLEPLGDEAADLLRGDGPVADLAPDLARRLGAVAGPVGPVELLERVAGPVDEDHLEWHALR